MTKRLVEEWLPIAELSEESVRERRSMSALPPVYYLHVWWARRPLVASRAAVLASLLPADADRNKFMHVLGIHGDPVKAKQRIAKADREGVRLGADAYGYPRAFSYSPSDKDIAWFKGELQKVGIDTPRVLDPTAGGGSIPFESLRLGCEVIANDLNPVAVLIQKATYEWSVKFSAEVLDEFKWLAFEFTKRVRERLQWAFPDEPNKDWRPDGYLWARTIFCPYCDGLIPLSPNWKLAPNGIGVRLLPQLADGAGTPGRVCNFEIVYSAKDVSEGTVTRGKATCPYPDCGRVITDKEIRQRARAAEVGEQLFTVIYKKRKITYTKAGKPKEKWERGYRVPRLEDDVSKRIQAVLEDKLVDWEALDIVPTEQVESAHPKSDPRRWGMGKWLSFFSSRQLLCHCTSVEVFRELLAEEESKSEFSEVTKAALGYLSLSLDKLRDYNSRMTRWHSSREVMANTFDRHDFGFKWSYAEMAPLIVGLGYDWAFEQTAKCLKELLELIIPGFEFNDKNGKLPLFAPLTVQETVPVVVTCKPGDNLDHLEDASIDAVIIDPPYYDNVMYAELSDFFYVWLKRTTGYIYPELFTRQLTDKDSEAVANPSKYFGQKGAMDLAAKDYRERIATIFTECRRVLKPSGIMTLMFTHKATGAWDALTKGLIEAEFVITASWPINTEATGSLHIKDKSAANSTIFLVCRPRTHSPDDEVMYWEDLEPLVKEAVRYIIDPDTGKPKLDPQTGKPIERILELKKAGISGVDVYLSCFGPALEVFSRHWPVKRGQPKLQVATSKSKRKAIVDDDPYSVSPEDALESARREVKRWKLEQLTNTQRIHELDPLTEWFVLAWDAFQAPQFPYDEALRLARVVGLDMDRDIIKVLAEKKSSDVILWDSSTRAAKGALGPTDGSRGLIDAIHHAAYLGRSRSLDAARELLEDTGVSKEPRFLAALEAILEVLPPSRAYTGFDPVQAAIPAASDFEALENLRRLAFTEQIDEPKQLELWAEEVV